MARETYVWDPIAQRVVTKNEFLASDHSRTRGSRAVIIRDIEPYKTAAVDNNGKRAVIGGRRQHREFLRRNGYVEVGSEMPRNRLQNGPKQGDVARDIKRVLGE